MRTWRCASNRSGLKLVGRVVPQYSIGQPGGPRYRFALPGSAGLYEDLVNEFLAAGADPHLLQADELRAQWRPDGPGVTLTPRISYAEPLSPDGTAAAHYAAPAPPVPAWDALALTSITRDRHVVAVLRAAFGETGQCPANVITKGAHPHLAGEGDSTARQPSRA